jgi:Domain of unknown function (DUF4157)
VSDSLTMATPEATNAASMPHIPVRENQMEAEIDRSAIASQQVMRSIGGGSPMAPPDRFAGVLGHSGASAQTGMLRQLQRSYGNSYVGSVIQAKLTVNQPGDIYEQEADLMAAQVMATPQSGSIQREMEPKKIQMMPSLQRTSDENQEAGGNLEGQINSSKGGGSPLPDDVRSFMEPRFGADFSRVRVYTGSESVQMNQDLNAQAFTHQQDVYFGAGKAPAKDALTAHELTHVVQQTNETSKRDTIQCERTTETPTHKINSQYDESSNRWMIDIDGIPVAEVAVLDKTQDIKIDINVTGNNADIVLRHFGNASLTSTNTAQASLGLTVNMREIDMRQGESGTQLNTPQVPGADNQEQIDITIVPPTNIQFPGEGSGENSLKILPPPGSLSEFEESLLTNHSGITGGVLDPETHEIIGYRVPATTGVTKFVDREGSLVSISEIGLETPVLDPIDFIPNPGAVARGAGIAGKVVGKIVLKGILKKEAVSGIKLSLGMIARMRGVSRALVGRAIRTGTKESVDFVSRITKAGLDHSFDRHAAQWFGRRVTRDTHMEAWRILIGRAAASRSLFPWSTGASETIAHLAQIEGKYFVVQFYKETGDLATAFVPSSGQLREMFRLLNSIR